MKITHLLLVCLVLYSNGFAQLNDTSALVYQLQPWYKIAHKHKIAGNTLTAFGFATLGIGILFGVATIIEVQKEIGTLPIDVYYGLLNEENKSVNANPEKYLYPAIGFLSTSIPLLVIGSIERRKARVSMYAASNPRTVVFANNSAQQLTVGLTISVPLGK
jgi:hypothetical protein